MDEAREYHVGIDKALKGEDKTCVTLARKDSDGVATIVEVFYGEVAEWIVSLLAELEQAEAEREALVESIEERCKDLDFAAQELLLTGRETDLSHASGIHRSIDVIRGELPASLRRIEDDCDHDFVDMTNEVVQGGEFCIICGGVRASLGED